MKRRAMMDIIEERSVPEPNTGCWLWFGWSTLDGYGVVQIDKVEYRAHRRVWEENNGQIPPGMMVRHRCDQPACVNLDHLTIGTHAENMADMVRRGRSPINAGEKNPRAKLSSSDVARIRSEAATKSKAQLAREFGVSDVLIGLVVRREAWA